MTSSFFRGACAVILAFSLTNKQSFNRVSSWHEHFRSEAHPLAFTILVGTKVDEKGRKVTSD